jgi:hypothetical protein
LGSDSVTLSDLAIRRASQCGKHHRRHGNDNPSMVTAAAAQHRRRKVQVDDKASPVSTAMTPPVAWTTIDSLTGGLGHDTFNVDAVAATPSAV